MAEVVDPRLATYTKAELLAEADRLRKRLRVAAQTLVAAIGADGPASAELLAERAAAVLENYRREDGILRAHVKHYRAERDTALARVAELEAALHEARGVAIRRFYRDGQLPDDIQRLSDFECVRKWEAALKGGG